MEKFRQNEKDTGSHQVQVGLLTERIKGLAGHLKSHPKDKHSRRGLVTMVDKRRKFLKYLKNQDEAVYKNIAEKIS